MATTPPAVRNVVFDIGGVLLDWDPRYLYRQLFGGDDEAMERFLAEVCSPAWHEEHDLGVPIATSCAALAELHPEVADLIGAWAERHEEMIAGVFEESAALLAELHSDGVGCYALSNMEPETYAVRVERFAFFSDFDGTVISGLEGVMKPDPAIYSVLLERFGLDPAETVFVDDRALNLPAASALGMHTVLFEGAPALRRSLRALGVAVRGA